MANTEPLVIEIRAEDETKQAFDSAAREQKKLEKAVKDTLKRMEDYKNTIGMTADEIQIYRLRQQGATKAQIEAAKQLQNQIALEKQAMQTKRGLNGQLRLIRGGFGQMGHQVQDVAVQLQGGTDAMIVFGQQGGQIASLFGPGGAIVGAFLAVGAAAFTAFRDVKVAENKFDELRTTLEGLKPAADASAEAIRGAILALQVAQLAEAGENIDDTTEAMRNQLEAAREAEAKMNGLADGTIRVRGGNIGLNAQLEKSKKRFQDQAGEAGRSLAQIIQFQKALEDMGIQASTPELEALKAEVVELGKAALEAGEPLTDALFTPESVTEAKEKIAEIEKSLLTGKDKINQQYQDMATDVVEAFRDSGQGGSAEFIALIEAVNKARLDAIAEIDKKEEDQAQREKDRAAAKEARDAKAAQAKVDASLRAQEQLQAIAANDVTDIDKVNKRYDAQIRAAHKAYQADTTLFKQYQDALIAIAANRAAAIDAINDKSFADHKQKIIDLRDTALAGFRTETENYIHNLMMRQMALDEALANKAISEAEHAQNSMRLEEMKAEHMLDQQLKIVGGLQNVESAITNASHAFITGAANGTEAMRMLGRAIMDELIKSIVQMGIEKAKQAIISKNIEAGSLSASVAANALAMTKIATASYPAAALVSLATSGGNAVGAQAGITSTAALAKATSLPSFEGGGFTGSGARSGGMDGRGGFLAMLHPNETIIDNTRGGGQDITIINNIDASGDGDVDQRIAMAVSESSRQTIEQMHNMMRRGRL